MKTNTGSPTSDPSNPPETQPAQEVPASEPPSGASPVSISGLAALTEDEASRFQDATSPHDIKGDILSEEALPGGLTVNAPDESREGKLIAAAILELFKTSGHPVPASLATGLREIAERGCLAKSSPRL